MRTQKTAKALTAILLIAVVYALTLVALAQSLDSTTPAGTLISVRAEATYLNEAGELIHTISDTVTLTVGAVSRLAVTPDDTVASATHTPRERITKVFRVCNTGNITDRFKVVTVDISPPAALVALYFDLDDNGIVSQGDTNAIAGTTVSPSLYADRCLGVLAVADTNDTAARGVVTLRLTAVATGQSSSASGGEDEGTIISAAGTGPTFSSPQNPQQLPTMLVDGQQRMTATPGQNLTFSLRFINSGDASALNVIVVNQLPTNLEYIPESLIVEITAPSLANGIGSKTHEAPRIQVVSGRIEVRIVEVALGQIVEIRFRARLSANAIGGGGTLNRAMISADNLHTSIASTDAVVISKALGIVYAAGSAGSMKVNGARVILSTDQMGENPIILETNSGIAPNAANANPFITGSDGNFNFTLSPAQVGTEAQPATYFISVVAQGFQRRLLELKLKPRALDLYDLTVRALDDQPIAEGGSFSLTREAVQIENLALLVLNVPLFESANFQITKTADKQRAGIGDTVSYRIVAHNALISTIGAVVVRDRLPASFHYVPGTSRIEALGATSRVVEPELSGKEMLFRLGDLGPGESVTMVYRVRVGANAASGEQFNSVIAEGASSSSQKVSTATARAGVVVGAGIFGMQRAIIGRVFEDANGNGEYENSERPLANARLYLSSGDSVNTDSKGMYNFPLVSEGSVTISLDPVSIIRGYKLLDDEGRSARSWTKLLRTPLGGGALLRQNFALAPPASSLTASPSPSVTPSPNPIITEAAPMAPGTYEIQAGDDVVPIAPGAARIDSPGLDQVILSAAMRLEATVAEGWTIAAEVNDEKLSETLIGERRIDHKNKVSTYTFIGLNVRPGINRIRITPISPEGKPGSAVESTVYGRGPAKRLEIVTEKKELAADGRSSTLVYLRAFDQWNHPAADAQVVLEVSSGSILSEACGADGQTNPCPIATSSPVDQSAIKGDLASGSNLHVEPDVGTRDQQIDLAKRLQRLSLSGGEARVYLISGNAPGNAELQAQTGQIEARAHVRFLPEMRSAILVGMAEATFGSAAPDRQWQGIKGKMSSRVSFFYRGSIFGDNLLTLAYDSHRPFHRASGRDRLYELDPRDRAYTIFGDSSTRFEEARSNSKLYARLDRGASFLLFGDFNPDQDASKMNGPASPMRAGVSPTLTGATRMLTGYSRNLTGVKLHLENEEGDSLTLTGARPDTAFARDVFPGSSFGFLQLSQSVVLQGSENVVLEIRDRRNPEIIVSREPLSRSIDYNLDVNTGVIFLLRPVNAFDYNLNLLQVVVTYEYSAQGLTSAVYTGRAIKQFSKLGLRLGASVVNQRQPELGPFYLGGIDVEKKLPRGGTLLLEWGISRGRVAAAGNLLSTDPANVGGLDHKGQSHRAELNQPLPFLEGSLKASVTQADTGFLNPFGATVAPGSRRAVATVDLKVRPSSVLHFGLGQERNKTETVDNQRVTSSIGWTEQINERLRVNAAYDFRKLTGANQTEISSHLFTLGADWKPFEKLTLAIKREQNLGDADPTYPNQTTLSASYQLNPLTRLFFTERLASAPIVPISDVSKTGFAFSNTRNEMAFGVETRLGRFTTLNSRYQIESGINGTDSFAVIGLANRLPISDTLSLELGFERGQQMTGAGASFNGGSVGFSWLPGKNFRTAARYELRDRNGFGQAITLSAAGKLGEDVTTLGTFQWAQTSLAGRSNSTMNGTAALALRPLHSDRVALLFSYTRRSIRQDSGPGVVVTVDRADMLSTDGLLSLTKRLEFYGRIAFKSGEDGHPDLAHVSTFTYMAQGRLQQRLSEQFDVATEFRWLAQPVTGTRRTSLGAETGYWLFPDLRLGVGYNLSSVREPVGNLAAGPGKSGFYFTLSSKLSNLFNLFGNSNTSLTTTGKAPSLQEATKK